MSVIIDMYMPGSPDTCWHCPCGEGGYCKITGKYASRSDIVASRPDWCPIEGEIPSTHGKLIDADAFDSLVRGAVGMVEEELPYDFKKGIMTALNILEMIHPSYTP